MKNLKNKLKVKKLLFHIYHDRLLLLLTAILVFGFLIRLLGVYPGYNLYHPDEGKAGYSSATYMFVNKTLDLPHYNYPSLIPLTQLILMVIFFLPIVIVKVFLSQPLLIIDHPEKLFILVQDFLDGGSKEVWLVYWSRYLTVIFSVLTIILTYLTGKILYSNRLIGILAALILAVNFKSITGSQLDLPDTYNAFYLTLSFFILFNLKNKPSLKLYILSAITIGFSISTKLQFFILLPFIVVLIYFGSKKKNLYQKIEFLFSKNILIFCFFFIITILLINIGPITHFQVFRETLIYQSLRYSLGINRLSPISLSYFYQIIITPAIFIFSLIGIFIGFKKNILSTTLILSLLLPYLYYFLYLTQSWFFPRNFVTIIPFFALLTGVGLYGFWIFVSKVFQSKFVMQILFLFVISLVIFESVKNSLIHDFYYLKPWNVTKMQQCLGKKVPDNVTIASHPWDVYTLFSLSKITDKKGLSFVTLDEKQTYSVAEFREKKAEYALFGFDILSYENSDWWMQSKATNFWNKPIDISKNTFGSLAALELFQFTLCSEIKPWQAVDNNYMFARVPKEIYFPTNKLYEFDFNDKKNEENWIKIDGSGGIGTNLLWDKIEGNKKAGSLKIKSGYTIYPVIRWVSPVFAVKENYGYSAEAWIKTGSPLDMKKRNGFLRLDFYQQKPKVWNESTLGFGSFISSRYFGNGWKQEKVFASAPKGVKWATVSFQVENLITSPIIDYWVDDIEINKSIEALNIPIRQQNEYWLKVDDNVLIPNIGSGF